MSDVCQDAPSKGDGAKARSDPPAAHRLPPLTTAMVDAGTVAIYEEAEPKWQQSRGEANDDLRYRFRSQAREGLGAGLGCRPGRYLDQIGALCACGAQNEVYQPAPSCWVARPVRALPLGRCTEQVRS